jgi:hypothetical protein
LHDISTAYGNYYQGFEESYITPVLNIHFLTSILFIAALGFIYSIRQRVQQDVSPSGKKWFSKFIAVAIPVLLISAAYISIRVEITNYWNQLYEKSALTISANGIENYYRNDSLMDFKRVWVANFSLLFFAVLAFVNMRKIRSESLAYVNMILIVLALLAFVQDGLSSLGSLRETYISGFQSEYYKIGIWNLVFRYVSYLFAACALYALGKYVRQDFVQKNLSMGFDAVLHITLICIASSEFLHITALANPDRNYNLGLSILWGIYALAIIGLGIWKKKKYLRIGAIIFFGITILKLFIFDISHLSTIAKTIVFVSLGVLLLIASFLYNKFKNLISDDSDK